jgi:aspartate racemase
VTNTIGLLGLGQRAVEFYLAEITAQYPSFDCRVFPADFDAMNALLPYLSTALDEQVRQALQPVDTDMVIVPNITLHETIDRIALTQSLIHPLKCAVAVLKQKHIDTITLIASEYSMTSDYIRGYFSLHGIGVTIPKERDRGFIDLIRRNVYAGEETAKEIAEFRRLMCEYGKYSPLVIACTELSIAVDGNMPNLYDMARIQVRGVVGWIRVSASTRDNIQEMSYEKI